MVFRFDSRQIKMDTAAALDETILTPFMTRHPLTNSILRLAVIFRNADIRTDHI